MNKQEYNEIKKLYIYCQKLSVPCVLEPLYDGYALRLKGVGDFVQHEYSYGSHRGCVEPAIGCRADYTAVTLKNAKRLVKKKKGCVINDRQRNN